MNSDLNVVEHAPSDNNIQIIGENCVENPDSSQMPKFYKTIGNFKVKP